MTFHRLIAISALLGAGALTPAWADGWATAKLSNISYTLIDLDPSDGIAPALTFDTTTAFSTGAGVNVQQFRTGQPGVFVSEFDVQAGLLTPAAKSISTPTWSAGGSVAGDGTLGGTTISASLSAPSLPGVYATYSASAGVMQHPTSSYEAVTFVLTANTKVIFSADVEAKAALSYGAYKPESGVGLDDFIQASGRLTVFDEGATPYSYGPRYAEDQEFAGQSMNAWQPGTVSSVGRVLSVSFENAGSTALNGGLRLEVSTYSEFFKPAPVPEPSSVWLGAVGALVVLRELRKRRSA